MGTLRKLLAGLGGALALNIIHEGLKKKGGNMPRIDLLGEEALQKSLHYFGTEIADDDNLYKATLAGDIVSNALYYSMIGAGGRGQIWQRAAGLGLAAGIGAVALPKYIGLDPTPVARNPKVAGLTIAYYVAGALVTGCILQAVLKKES